jgi:hypothetical protein
VEELLPKHHANAEKVSHNEVPSTFQLSTVVLKELKMTLSRSTKKPLVPAGSRSTIPPGGARVHQRSSLQLAGKHKVNALASSSEKSEPVKRSPTPTAGSAPLPVKSSVTVEQVVISSRQLVRPREGVRTRLFWPGQLPLSRQVDRSSPQP